MVDNLKQFIYTFKNTSNSQLIESMINGLDIIFENKLVGGRVDAMTIEDIAQKHDFPIDKIKEQLEMGDEVEKEHTDDPEIAREIAMDHEAEIPDYYDRLDIMEKTAGIVEGQGFYPEPKYPNPASYRDNTIFSIMSMFKAMNDKHKNEFIKQVDGMSKWQLEKYPDDYLMRLKENASNMRNDEKDLNRKPVKPLLTDRQMQLAQKAQKADSKSIMDEYNEYRKHYPKEND